MTAPAAGTPAATAPGRAAYEAYFAGEPSDWEALAARYRTRWHAAGQAAIGAGNAEPPAVRIGRCPVDSHDAEHVQVRTGTAWLCGEVLAELLAANGIHVASRLAKGNERLRAGRDSLTGRAAELAAENGELRACVGAEAWNLADQAIGLFLEYRDVHGHDEASARASAAREVAEGAAVTDAEISARPPAAGASRDGTAAT